MKHNIQYDSVLLCGVHLGCRRGSAERLIKRKGDRIQECQGNPAKFNNKPGVNLCPKCVSSNSASCWLKLLSISCPPQYNDNSVRGLLSQPYSYVIKNCTNNGLDTVDSDDLMMQRPAIFSRGINKHMSNSSTMAASGWMTLFSIVTCFLLTVRKGRCSNLNGRGPAGK